MKARLELTANVVLIGVALLIAYVLLKNYQTRPQSRNNEIQSLVKPGDRLPNLSGYEWRLHSRTLVLAIRKGCHYCEASMPFYRRLASLEQSHQTGVHLLAVLPNSPAEVSEFLSSEDLPVQAIPMVSLETIKVTGTPTLILVDEHGQALQAWVGQLPAAGEADVVKAITLTKSSERTESGVREPSLSARGRPCSALQTPGCSNIGKLVADGNRAGVQERRDETCQR